MQFNLLGPDIAKLSAYADQIMAQMHEAGGIVDIDTTLSNRKPELQVHIDRVKASQFGLQVAAIPFRDTF